MPSQGDFHTHSTISDGRLTPAELVHLAHRNGVRIMSLTDHDIVDGLPEAFEADARAHGFETRSLWDAAVPLSAELERTVCEYRDRQVDAVQRLIFPIHGIG